MAEILLRSEDVPADLAWAFEPIGGEATDVFVIPTEPTPFAHFATWPQALVRRMILAGTSERGKCPECGKPWVRQTSEEYVKSPKHGVGSIVGPRNAGLTNEHLTGGRASKAGVAGQPRVNKSVTTLGWSPSCACGEYVCPACDNELDHDSRTTSMSGVRDAVRPEGSPQETEVLLSGVRERRQDEADADVDVRGMRQAVLAQDTEHEAGAVLLEDVRESRDGPEPAVDQGIRDRREGLSADPRSWSSDGEPRGVRDGTPPSNVRTTGADADAGRGSPSPERGEGRQPSGEPSGYSEGSARSNAEAAQDNDRVSALRRDDQDVQRCADCGTALEHRPHHPRPAVVLDVFAGSGTTLLVARNHGRHSIGIELNADYLAIAATRLQQLSLLAEGAA